MFTTLAGLAMLGATLIDWRKKVMSQREFDQVLAESHAKLDMAQKLIRQGQCDSASRELYDVSLLNLRILPWPTSDRNWSRVVHPSIRRPDAGPSKRPRGFDQKSADDLDKVLIRAKRVAAQRDRCRDSGMGAKV